MHIKNVHIFDHEIIGLEKNAVLLNKGPDRLCQVKAMFKQHENHMI